MSKDKIFPSSGFETLLLSENELINTIINELISTEGLKKENKPIWQQIEDDINEIDGNYAFDVLKGMIGG